MSDVIGLVLPFFGMIFIGFLVARITRQPLEALGWMNIFIVYVALPPDVPPRTGVYLTGHIKLPTTPDSSSPRFQPCSGTG